MKKYTGLFILLTSSISGMTPLVIQTKPVALKSMVQQVKTTINTPTGKTIKKTVPYLIIGAYYIRCTSKNNLLPIPGFQWLKTNLIGGESKEKRFSASLLTKLTIDGEEKTVQKMFEEWKEIDGNEHKKPGDYANVFKEQFPDYILSLEDHSIQTNTLIDQMIKQWKKTGILSKLFNLTLITYATKALIQDTNDAINYLTSDEE